MRVCSHHRLQRRGSALFVTVLGTALIVSLLALGGLTVVRIERRQAANLSAVMVARTNARSAVDLALAQLSNSTDWRTTYAAGTESTLLTLGADATGTCSWSLQDMDGSFDDADTKLVLQGIGRVDDTVQVASVEIDTAQSADLRSYEGTTGAVSGDLLATTQWAQYFRPTLPSGVNGWKITSVEFLCTQNKKGYLFDISLCEPTAGNMPSSNVLESVTVDSTDVTKLLSWQTFTLPGSHLFTPDEGVCLTLTTAETTESPILVRYMPSGVSQTDSALILGSSGTWHTYAADQSLLYRVHGVCLYDYGDIQAVVGSWTWEAAP